MLQLLRSTLDLANSVQCDTDHDVRDFYAQQINANLRELAVGFRLLGKGVRVEDASFKWELWPRDAYSDNGFTRRVTALCLRS